MKNRFLLALACLAALVAFVVWAVGARPGSSEVAHAEPPDSGEGRVIPALESAPDAERSSLPSQGEAGRTSSAVDSDGARAVSDGVPFRGQVVDVRTGEPVPSAIAKGRGFKFTIEAPTNAEGRFSHEAFLPSDFEEIAFFNAHDPAHIRTAPRRELEWLGKERGWLARIRIGPTFRLRLVGANPETSTGWQLRIVESAPDVPDRATAWIRVVAGDSPWARFDNPLPEPPPGATERIDVQNDEGTLRGSAPIQTIVGIHPDLVTVSLDGHFARVLGRVVDSTGKALTRAQVAAIPRLGGLGEDGKWPGGRTDGEGRYAIGGLLPGTYWVHARPRRGEEAQTIEIALPLGDTTAPDLVAPAQPAAGAIEGFLRSGAASDFPTAIVRLRATDGRRYEHYDVVDTSQQADLEGATRPDGRFGGTAPVESKGFFEFQQVPEGEYELSVLATDGSRWSPSPLRVRPPRLDLEIVREEDPGSWVAGLRVVDARTAEPIQRFRARMWMEGIAATEDFESVPGLEERNLTAWPCAAGARFRWSVVAEGYRLTTGTEKDFVVENDKRVATVRLQPGFGARIVLRDAQGNFGILEEDWEGRVAALEHPPVVGARVFADGVLVATSDAQGIATIEAQAAPGQIEILAPGWTMLGSRRLQNGRIVSSTWENARVLQEADDIVVWMLR